MYLFDTDTITNILKKKPSPQLISKLKALNREQQYVSTITISEIVYGAMKSKNPEYHLKNLEELILPAVNILAFDSQAAFSYGKIRAELEQQGMPLTHTDIQIAAIALANNLILVTGNAKHFKRIAELKFENWIE